MTRKITFRFVLYFLGFYCIVALLTIGVIFYSFFGAFSSLDIYGDIREMDDETMDLYVKEKNDHYTFTDGLVHFVERNQAILQLIDENGDVILSSSDDHSLPDTYTYTDLVETTSNPTQTMWNLESGKILLYTEQTRSDFVLQELQKSKEFPQLTNQDKALLQDYHAIFDVYDKNGELIYSTDNQKKLKNQEIMKFSHNPLYSKEVKAYTTLNDDQFAMVRIPNEHYRSLDTLTMSIVANILKALAMFHIVLFILIIIFSFIIGRKFGRPILYFLRKIKRLAAHDYSDEEDGKMTILKNGKIKRKYKMFTDVNDSLTTLTHNLQSNERQIAQTERLREDWITGLSHDLKTPLSTVLGYAAMLGSEHAWTNEERKKFANTIEEKASYMDELINELTYTYQLKNKGVELEKERIQISTFIADCLQHSPYKNVSLVSQDTSVYALLDTKRFHRVIDNLLVNALTHNKKDTIVHIRVYTQEEQAIIDIIDNGQGMSEETVENLFNRYYRGTNTTSEDTGTGLGLTIAKQLIEAHDGSIHVHSNQAGTTVTITLPLAD